MHTQRSNTMEIIECRVWWGYIQILSQLAHILRQADECDIVAGYSGFPEGKRYSFSLTQRSPHSYGYV